MKAITINAKIRNLQSAGKTVGQIAKACKLKKAAVQELIANNAVTTASHYVNVIGATGCKEVVTEAAPVVNNKLVMMLAAAATQQQVVNEVATTRVPVTTVKVAASPFKDAEGNTRQKRNYEVAERKIVVFYSDALHAAYVTTNLAYITKTYDGAIKHARNDLRIVKCCLPLIAQADMRMEIRTETLNVGDALNVAKAAAFDALQAEGWNMIGARPRVPVLA